MTKKYCYNDFFMNFFFGEEKMKTREDKRIVKLDFSTTAFFGHVLKKISASIFWCMVSPLDPHSVYT